MTIHPLRPTFSSATLVEANESFEVVKSCGAFVAIRHRTEGHMYTFFFNSAHTALASVQVKDAPGARYQPDYFQEAAWRFADQHAREEGLIFAGAATA